MRSARNHALVAGVLFAAVAVAHWPFLGLAYFWDEAGQFVPSALDILRDGAWVPHSAVPNVHPPGVMAFLALVWRVFGFTPVVTRLAMLAVGAAGLYVTFLLAIRWLRNVQGMPAFAAVALLAASPLFFAQCLLAQLDMPAMTLTALSLLLFFNGHLGWSVAACTALVMTKETGIVVPAVFAAWLVFGERRVRDSLWFAIPAVALLVWLAVLKHATGHWLGDAEFTQYNVAYQLHPVRLAATLARRIYYLFFAEFRFIGTAVMLAAWWKSRARPSAEWIVAGSVTAAHVVLVTIFGGAALERYLLPVLPLVYCAMAAGLFTVSPRWRYYALTVMVSGLMIGMLWTGPVLYPFENNLDFADFIKVQQVASDFVESSIPGTKIATAWPYSAGLRNPDLGYVTTPHETIETGDFSRANVEAALSNGATVLMLYARAPEPDRGVLRIPAVYRFLARYYGYQPQITARELEQRFGMRSLFRWQRAGHWVEVLSR